MNSTIYTATQIKNMESRQRAHFVNSLSGFKSANLIGTQSQGGYTNLSVVSSAFHLGATPALMGMIFRPDSVERHTLENLRETNFCTLNHINKDIFKQAHQCSARYPREISEFDETNLTPEYHPGIPAPFVAESSVKLGLKLVREEKVPENGTQMCILSIEKVIVPKECLAEDGFVDIEKAKTVAVSGLDSYHLSSPLARLEYAKP